MGLAVIEVEANLIGATAHAPSAPCVATMTQSWAQRDPVVEVSGPVDALVRTTKVVDPEPWPSVKMKGCAASCGPHPNAFASSALSHSERYTFCATPKPVTLALTHPPSTRSVPGPTATLGAVEIAERTRGGGPQGHRFPMA